ncbi:MAG: hypothetical protein HY244_04025 [Rhizobiales bacterium]|nr:hypothetical protein [Hyphomicrobiales bacterium]
MRKLAFLFALAVTSIAATSFVTPAFAQATRTWISGVGDDVNPCSRTAPCKTFAGAISKTASGGAIDVLDPGGFGAVTITKPITLRAEFVEAGVLISGGSSAINVNVPNATDEVILIGLDIEGLGTGLHGVNILTGGNVIIRRCTIHHFSGNGVNLVNSVAGAKVLVQDSVISNNGGGVNVQGSGGVASTGTIDRVTIETHTNFAFQIAQGGTGVMSLSNLIGTGTKVVLSGTGAIQTYGNNVIRGASAALPPALPLQ